jgi:hypothetical protein
MKSKYHTLLEEAYTKITSNPVMTKVYIVYKGGEWEAHQLLSVHATEEGAKKRMSKIVRAQRKDIQSLLLGRTRSRTIKNILDLSFQ